MITPYISVKSVAKILLLLMMPGSKGPDPVPLSQQVPMAVQYFMAHEPVVTEYGEGFLLQFRGLSTEYLISQEQMDQFIIGMSDAEKDAIFRGRTNFSEILASHIIQQNYLPCELPETSSSSRSTTLQFSPTGHTINDHYQAIRRTQAPTVWESIQDLFARKPIYADIRVTSVPQKHHRSRPIRGKQITIPPGNIDLYTQRGDIKMLQLIRDCLLADHQKWFPSADYYDIREQLKNAEESLIDLGCIEYPQLQKMRDLAKRGDTKALQARYDKLCAMVKDKSCNRDKRIKEEGGSRIVKLEQYYLTHIKNNPLVESLLYVTTGEGPELRWALTNVYRKYYREFSQDCTYYEHHAGFNIIETAHAHAMQHPNGAQIIAAAQQDFAREMSASSSSSAPTTTASTAPGTTTTTYAPSSSSSSFSASMSNIHLIPAQDAIIEALDSCQDIGLLADRLGLISHDVLSYAQQVNYEVHPDVHDHIEISIDTIRTTQDTPTIAFHVSYVEHVLTDIQTQAQPEQAQQPTLLERSPQLLTRALEKFITGLNPITQVKNTVEFWVSTAHFVADVTVGKLYLKSEDYKARIDGFWETLEAMSPANLAQLSAEQWVDMLGQMAADAVYARGAASTIAYLKEIDAVAKAQRKVKCIADKFKQGLDNVIGKNPLVVTPDGLVMRMSNEFNDLTTGAREIIKDSRTLLESSYGKLMLQLEAEILELRRIFDTTRKGFGTFAHKNIKINYKHILGMDIKFYPDHFKFGGFHHDLMGAIEKSSIVKFTNKVIDKTGVYRADLIVNGKLIRDKTFFPSSWSRKQVIDAICEVYDNYKKTGVFEAASRGGTYTIQGLTSQGIQILMTITENGLITTAYPIIKL